MRDRGNAPFGSAASARRGLVVLHFDSLTAAVAATGPILACQPSAVGVVRRSDYPAGGKSLEYRHYLDFVVGRPESLVLVEFFGDTDDEVRRQAARAASRIRGQPGLACSGSAQTRSLCPCLGMPQSGVAAADGNARPAEARSRSSRTPPSIRPGCRSSCDSSRDPKRAGTDGAFYGHASVGCLHIRPLLGPGRSEDLARLEQISRRGGRSSSWSFGGAMSGEHGDGLARSYLNERLFGPRLYAAFKQIKAAFDPAGIMNPGKVVDGPSPIENLRQPPDAQAARDCDARSISAAKGDRFIKRPRCATATASAASGPGGTMCPSFMATGDEEHSTRGRAKRIAVGALWAAVRPSDLPTGGCTTHSICACNARVARPSALRMSTWPSSRRNF